jgi:hypothetical protein
MRFNVRIKESDILEHIYEFEDMWCRGYQRSRRSGPDDIWGFDWSEHFDKEKNLELKAYDDKYGEEYSGYDWEAEDEYYRICDKYNPIMNKTSSGKTYLGGSYSSTIMKDYPPTIPIEEFHNLVREEAIKWVMQSKIR